MFDNQFNDIMSEIIGDEIHRRKIEKVDQERARRLRAYIKSRRWTTSFAKARWAKAFGILRRQLKDDHNKIDLVLDHIIKHKVDKPKITDGRDLIVCWKRLTEMIEDHVVPSEQAQRIAEKVKDLGWPKHIRGQLAIIVQLSLNAVTPFLTKVRELAKEYAVPIPVKYDPKKHPKWAKHRSMTRQHPKKYHYETLAYVCGSPERFVERHLKYVVAHAQQMPTFSWHVNAVVFKPDQGFGQAFGRYNYDWWDTIYEEVTKDG